VSLKKICLIAVICSVTLTNHALANSGTGEETISPNVPSTSYWGTRGLSQTAAAEPLGDGRINFAISGSNFKQEQTIESPRVGKNVSTGRAAFSFGLNSSMDAFALLPVYKTSGGDPNVGGFVGGVNAVIPMHNSPVKLGAQLYGIYGFKDNKVTVFNNEMYYAGYDYFDATGETGLGVGVKLTQSIVAGGQKASVKFHFNEGFFKNPGHDLEEGLLMLAMGLQVDPNSFMTMGLELNSRTKVKNPTVSDPFWVTPSVMFRTPANVGFLFGSDITTSRKKSGKRPLEKYRLFGDVVLSFDMLASKRTEAAQKRRDELNAKAELERQTQELAAQKESLAQKMAEDSIRAAQSAEQMTQQAQSDAVRAKAIADSLENLAGSIAQKAQQDSAAMAEAMAEAIRVKEEEARAQREADSLALAVTQKHLAEERARRTEAEQSFLSTGMLTLDNSVQFQSGRTDIPHNARAYLTLTAKMLAKYPKLKIEIGGHTDNIGGMQANMNISQQRAESVFTFMVGIEPQLSNSLSAKGYGPTMPKADNNTADGRQINRRIELKVLNPEVLKEYNP